MIGCNSLSLPIPLFTPGSSAALVRFAGHQTIASVPEAGRWDATFHRTAIGHFRLAHTSERLFKIGGLYN